MGKRLKVQSPEGGPIDVAEVSELPLVPQDGENSEPNETPVKTLVAAGKPELPPRPTLEVATETYSNLKVRMEALCQRMLAWKDAPSSFTSCVRIALEKFREIGPKLEEMRQGGFVAKSTERTRLQVLIENGGRVKLCDHLKKVYRDYYSPEELDQVTIVGSDGPNMFVKLGKREGVIPFAVKITQLEPG